MADKYMVTEAEFKVGPYGGIVSATEVEELESKVDELEIKNLALNEKVSNYLDSINGESV